MQQSQQVEVDGRAVPMAVGPWAASGLHFWRVSVVGQPDKPALVVFPPEEALRRARPLPSVEELTIEGLTLDEWTALNTALAGR